MGRRGCEGATGSPIPTLTLPLGLLSAVELSWSAKPWSHCRHRSEIRAVRDRVDLTCGFLRRWHGSFMKNFSESYLRTPFIHLSSPCRFAILSSWLKPSSFSIGLSYSQAALLHASPPYHAPHLVSKIPRQPNRQGNPF